ncbi:MAG: hypothetical protein SH868_17120 [Bythopirellula sp.]|nr:hypothetical protein [Bythopirellula sp.]
MAIAKDIHGTVFRHGTAMLMARVVDGHAAAINQASLASASYTVFALEQDNPASLTAVVGHEEVLLDVAEIVFDTLQTGGGWTVDEVGYNFRHELDVSEDEAFSEAGRVYQVRYELVPVMGQKIVFRFQLKCV